MISVITGFVVRSAEFDGTEDSENTEVSQSTPPQAINTRPDHTQPEMATASSSTTNSDKANVDNTDDTKVVEKSLQSNLHDSLDSETNSEVHNIGTQASVVDNSELTKLHKSRTQASAIDASHSSAKFESRSLMDLLTAKPSDKPLVDIKVRGFF